MNTRSKTFVISLARARQRRLAAIRQIQACGLEFEIIDAIDANLVVPHALPYKRGPLALSSGELACYYSHLGVLQRILDYRLDSAIVLEDDFRISEPPHMRLSDLSRSAPSWADHIQLHNEGGKLFAPYKVLETIEGFNVVSPTNFRTVGYYISARLAAYVINNYSIADVPIDLLFIRISMERKFRFLDVREPLIVAGDEYSSTIIRQRPFGLGDIQGSMCHKDA